MKPNRNDMHPELLKRFLEWEWRVKEGVGLEFVITCIKRTHDEQNALYSQGRDILEETNRLRKIAGMPPIGAKENGYKVTWTHNSKHFPDDAGYVRAFDFALLVPGKKIITWDTKWDNDHNGVPEYLECANIAKAVGLEAGAFWVKSDKPHIQWNPDA